MAAWHEPGEASPFGPFVPLLIAAGQRRNEVVGMDFAEIDLAKREWLIPAARSKNGVAHIVPLNGASITILEGLGAKTRKRALVFTTTDNAIGRSQNVNAALNSIYRALGSTRP